MTVEAFVIAKQRLAAMRQTLRDRAEPTYRFLENLVSSDDELGETCISKETSGQVQIVRDARGDFVRRSDWLTIDEFGSLWREYQNAEQLVSELFNSATDFQRSIMDKL